MLNFGGTLRHMWIWSAFKLPSNNSTPRYRQSSFIISPTWRLNFPYNFLFRYFGIMTTWFGKKKPLWDPNPPFKTSYDAVIIGGGLHGLATAYFLARDHGITNVAVIEKRFIGFGGAGRNTAIVRPNQHTQENIPLYKEALDLWSVLTKELDFNLMFYNCGNLNLCHSEAAMTAARMAIASFPIR